MSDTQAKTEYDRGVIDAKKHSRKADPNWIRATFGPLLFVGIPIAATFWYMKRPAIKGFPVFGKKAKAAAGSVGEKSSKNPFSDMMEMMNPIQKRDFLVDVKGTKFSDVVGVPEALEEVAQYVKFLKTPEKFTKLGARLPKGCLLTGEPGTGKTLIAKAVAGEAGVPFFSCSGADFIEVMGGSGPKRVRDLFSEARGASPCIVFIDEIDAIGSRGGGKGGSVGSEENRTINQLLAELDGLSTGDETVVVMAATNFQDNIDKALLREGRFDRKINVDMPDLRARQDIFNHYLKKIVTGDSKGKLTVEDMDGKEVVIVADPDVDNDKIALVLADLTPGVSPATAATIVNEAALASALAGDPVVKIKSVMEAIDDVIIGKKQRQRLSMTALERTAIHESGHALCFWMLPQQKNVLKVSVTPRGSSMGFTQKAGNEYHEYQTNVTLFSDIVCLMGGRAAEDVLIGDPSAGAMDDLQRATELAMTKLIAHGMSHNTGMLSFDANSAAQGRSFVAFSESTQMSVEAEVKKMIDAAYAQSRQLVEQNKDKILAMSRMLVDKKEIVTADIVEIWGERPSRPTVEDATASLDAILHTAGGADTVAAGVKAAALSSQPPKVASVSA